MKKSKKLLIANLLLSFLLVCFSFSIFAEGYKITILHTNDHHGRFWKNKNNEYGMAARKTLIDKIRKEVSTSGGHLLLLSGGDINTGVPESDLQDAEPDFRGMAKLRYDAMALGNHEFDNSLEVLKKQSEWAGFPFLSANTIYQDSRKHLYSPYIVKIFNGFRVAIIGFTTQDTKIIGNPEFLAGIEFLNPVAVAKSIIPKLKEKNDLVIAVTHMGHYQDGNSGGNAPGDVTLARSVSGLDVIVGGHSQVPLFEPDIQNGTLVLQAHEWGKYVGRLDLELYNGEVIFKDYKLIPINLTKKVKDADGNSMRVFIEDEIPENQELKLFLEPYFAKGQESLQKIIGNADDVFVGERKFVRFQETNLGNLIALAQMSKTDSDLAVMNSGGIRADLQKGDISYKDVLIVQPFANTLCTVTLNGKELKDYLETVANKEKGTGAFAQFAGVTITFAGEKLTSARVNGVEVSDSIEYKLSLNSYIAAGGDGYPKVTDHSSFVNTGYVDADMLQEYIIKNSPLAVEEYKPTNDVIRNP